MSLSTIYQTKVKITDDFISKMSSDEKKILLRKLIKTDMDLFFETIRDEQRFLEKETGIDGAYLEEATGCADTSSKIWIDGREVKEKDIEDVRPENIGKVSKEAENAWYLDQKRAEKLGDDKYDGFLGYINSEMSAEEDTDV